MSMPFDEVDEMKAAGFGFLGAIGIPAVLILLGVLLLCCGCSVKQAHVVKPDGTEIRVTINSILTSERSEGLSYGRVDGEVMLELGPMGADPEAEQLGAILGAAIKEATK